jgi:F0F1-type ATP synthase membrane subunit b/b'
MNEEFDDDILEADLADDALERTMKKAENEAARILKQSNELVKVLIKDTSQQEEEQIESEQTVVGEDIESSN